MSPSYRVFASCRLAGRVRSAARVTAGSLGIAFWSTASSAAPLPEDFTIRYFATDEAGSPERELTLLDMGRFVNRARCECKQAINARITLSKSDDNSQLVTYVGNSCDVAQRGDNNTKRPCPILLDQLAGAYQNQQEPSFEPNWLASGVADGSPQEIADATPYRDCESGDQEGGVWICVKDSNDCDVDDFIVTGTQNANSVDEPKGIKADFQAPNVSTIQDLRAIGGDGSIVVKWSQSSASDATGFRLLCADTRNLALDDRGYEPRAVESDNRADIYYTAGNLCQNIPFPWPDGERPPSSSVAPTDDTGGSDTSGSDTAGSDTSGSDTAGSGTGGSDTGTSGEGTDTSGSGDDTGGTTGSTDLPDDGIESLDWSYVCSDHIPRDGTSARVTGLENGREYRVLLVAYDEAGNPQVVGNVMTAIPQATSDLWDQCEIQNACGEGGFCRVAPARGPDDAGALWLLGLFALGSRRRW